MLRPSMSTMFPSRLRRSFPGSKWVLGGPQPQLEIARRTARTVRLEGGNDLVYQPLIRARLGVLDLEWFKREVRLLQPDEWCRQRSGSSDRRKIRGCNRLRFHDAHGHLD